MSGELGGREGIEREATGRDGTQREGTESDGTRRDGTGREGTRPAAGDAAVGDTVAAGDAAPDTFDVDRPAEPEDVTPRAPRPLVERLGMAAIAVVLAAVFAIMAAAAFEGGEPFLGVMAGVGSLMTLWVGGLTLRRG